MLLEEGVCYDQGVLLAKLCYPLSCFTLYSKAKLACYSKYLLTSYVCIPIPYDEKDIFLGVLEGVVGLHRTSQLRFLQHQCLGIDLDYSDVEWFALEMNLDDSVVYEITSKYCFSDSFVDYKG